jgi:hypothetical protein
MLFISPWLFAVACPAAIVWSRVTDSIDIESELTYKEDVCPVEISFNAPVSDSVEG